MILTPLLPPGEPLDPEAPEARDELRRRYSAPAGDWLRLNLIASIDGSAQGADGTSETLSNAADRALLKTIRSLADVVLIGAASFRAESYVIPRAIPLAVVTSSGDLSGARVPSSADRPGVIVLGPPSVEDRARSTLPEGLVVRFLALPPSSGRVEPAAVIAALRGEGLRSIVCEGGPGLAAQLLDAGLVDELCLSLSPSLAGTGLPVLGGATARPLRRGGVMADDAGGLYTRWFTAL